MVFKREVFPEAISPIRRIFKLSISIRVSSTLITSLF
jgi:hypothetical protein